MVMNHSCFQDSRFKIPMVGDHFLRSLLNGDRGGKCRADAFFPERYFVRTTPAVHGARHGFFLFFFLASKVWRPEAVKPAGRCFASVVLEIMTPPSGRSVGVGCSCHSGPPRRLLRCLTYPQNLSRLFILEDLAYSLIKAPNYLQDLLHPT